MKNTLLQPDCFVSTITLAAIRKLGLQSLQMQPQTLRDLVQQTFQLGQMSQRLYDKLNCGYSMIGTDLYTRSIQCFLACNAVMAGKPLDADKVAYNTLYDVAWGVWQYCNLVGQMQDQRPTEIFSQDIKVYIREIAKVHGITKLPTWLQFANTNAQLPQQVFSSPEQLQAYSSRQQQQINKLNVYIAMRQSVLHDQLLLLKKQGIFA